MTPVILETPYRGDGSAEAIAKNKAYLNKCILDCLRRGETPYASHKMLTDALDEAIQQERGTGMHAGFAMHHPIPRSRVYVDLGISSGMRDGVCNMLTVVHGVSVFRRIGERDLGMLEYSTQNGKLPYIGWIGERHIISARDFDSVYQTMFGQLDSVSNVGLDRRQDPVFASLFSAHVAGKRCECRDKIYTWIGINKRCVRCKLLHADGSES